MTNIEDHPNGCIVVGWNASKLQLRCIASSAQWVTCKICKHLSLTEIRLMFVYGFNRYKERTDLWKYIQEASEENKHIPWSIMGDFNAVLRPSDRSGEASAWQRQHGDFPECITRSSLQQVQYNGIHLSWHNEQTGVNTIMKKLDWVFGNLALITKWPTARTTFLPQQVSDHSAMILGLEDIRLREKSSFKFINQWAKHGDFQDIVRRIWQQPIAGNPMFQLMSKLIKLKQQLQAKHRRYTGHISHKVFTTQMKWNEAQQHLDMDPSNERLQETKRQQASIYMNFC